MKRQVRDLIRNQEMQKFATVSPEQSIFRALEILDSSNTSAMLVMESQQLVGIFSEKDFARAIVRGQANLYSKVKLVMTSKVYYAEPGYTLEECMQIMSVTHIRHLPILELDRPIALLSMRHIMEALVDDKDTQIRQLTTYIAGTSSVDNFEAPRNIRNKLLVYSGHQNQKECAT